MSESAAGLTVTPAELAPDAAIDAVLGAVTEASRCWCRWWMLANADYASTDPQSRRVALDGDRAAGPSTGLVALRGEDAVGWVGVASRPRYARLPRTKAIAVEAGDTDVSAKPAGSLNTGTLRLFAAHGFTEVGRTGARIVVRLT